MAKIHQLSLQEIQKIAAGEVIDRPANIVKELIENSLDAGATHIKVFIEEGGKKLIRIIDNGCGMAPDDAHLCFAHHATSKITGLSDLESCKTFGFRGEALSSIASVSRVTMVTKDELAQIGIKLVLVDGIITDELVVSANRGTDIVISDLFYTVPARKKFLKTDDTEWRQILHLVQAYCLEYRAIHFELFKENNLIINCPPTETFVSRVAQLWDADMSNAMIPLVIADQKKNIAIEGVVSHHHYAKYDRSSIFMFVNRRWIKNQHLCKAILKGYANVLPPARYPAAVISITVDSVYVDINIHPRKEEVKFLHPQMVETLLCDGVKNALESNVSKKIHTQQQMHKPVFAQIASYKEASYPSYGSDFSRAHDPFRANFFEKPIVVESRQLYKETNKIPEQINLPQEDPFIEQSEYQPAQQVFVEQEKNLSVISTLEQKDFHVNIIGQYKKTYIMIEHEEGLLLIDQHAAHERILYDSFASRFDEIATVKNMFPVVINLSEQEYILLEPQLSILYEQGIYIEPFGKNQLVVSATPVHLQHIDMQELVREFIGLLSEDIQQDNIYQYLNDKLRALMACKAAVKAGDILDINQMKKIVADLNKSSNKLTCPHGRPTSWMLEFREIEKKFKRDYRSHHRVFE